MTDADRARVAEIAEREKAASPGRWVSASQNKRKNGVALVGIAGIPGGAGLIAVLAGSNPCRHEDAKFIAEARQDIPFLLARLQEAEGERERLREAVQALADSCSHCDGIGWVVMRKADSREDWHRVECECRRWLRVVKDG